MAEILVGQVGEHREFVTELYYQDEDKDSDEGFILKIQNGGQREAEPRGEFFLTKEEILNLYNLAFNHLGGLKNAT